MIYHESLIRQLYSRKYLWATHVWNMFDFAADAREEGGTRGRNNKGLSDEDRRRTTMQFSLLQLIRIGAPDMPRERIIAINQQLNQIPKAVPLRDMDMEQAGK